MGEGERDRKRDRQRVCVKEAINGPIITTIRYFLVGVKTYPPHEYKTVRDAWANLQAGMECWKCATMSLSLEDCGNDTDTAYPERFSLCRVRDSLQGPFS